MQVLFSTHTDPARHSLYQGRQELRRLEPRLSVLFGGDADPDFVSDAVDPPRLEIAVEPALRGDLSRAIERPTLPGQVARREARSRRRDVTLASACWIEAAGGAGFLERHGRAPALMDMAGASPALGATMGGFTPWRSFPALRLSSELARKISARLG